MIGLLSLTLACMPTGKMNKEWDHEDPNQEIPAHEAPAKEIEHNSDEIGPATDIEQHSMTKQGNSGNSQHIETGPNKPT